MRKQSGAGLVKVQCKAHTLQSRKSTLCATSALTAAPRLITAAIWTMAFASVAVVPTLLAQTYPVRAEDIKGNTGGIADTWKQYGGFGNGGGGSAYHMNNLGNVSNVLPIEGHGVDGAKALGRTGRGAGGAGGAVGATVIGSGLVTIVGQAGEKGGDHLNAGGGGGGGAGLYLGNTNASTYTGLSLIGGAGGNGGGTLRDDSSGQAPGGGGGGGAGVITNGGTFLNVAGGIIIGGQGGAAGEGVTGITSKDYAGAGAGGDGAVIQTGTVFTNFGTIKGGDAGSIPVAAPITTRAYAGSGVRMGDGVYFINQGTVTPGQSMRDGTAAIAIVGNNSTLELRAGSDIQGNVAVSSGVSGTTLALGGDTNSSFAASSIGTVYAGFNAYKKIGTSTWTLTGTTTIATPWVIEAGTLSVASNASLGAASGGLTVDGGTLLMTESFDDARAITLGSGGGTFDVTSSKTNGFSGRITGAGSLTKSGSGKLVLSNIAAHSGGTTVSAGTLQVGSGGLEGSISGNIGILSGATLEFNHSNIEDFSGQLSGAGTLKIDSPGGLTLSGDNSGFTGSTLVNGTTTVNSLFGTSAVTVSGTGELAGRGRISGDTTIASGGRLIGTQGATLSFDRDLSLSEGSFIDVALGAESTQALFDVGGDLTLKGTMNVSSLGGFGGGTYRIFDYAGQLVNSDTVLTDVSFGTLHDGMPAGDLTLLTTVDHQVSLLNSEGIDVNFWDGANPGGGSIGGGSGVWNMTGSSWTDVTGNATNMWNDQHFAIFTSTAGTVTIDNGNGPVRADGLQFDTDGYQLIGNALLLGNNGTDKAVVRVGDGTVAGAAITAKVASQLQGTQGLQKTDYGTLILTGENSYTGGTAVQNGILQIGDGGTSGSILGDIVVGVNDTDAAALVYKLSGSQLVSSLISGSGTLENAGSGTIILSGENTYAGGTTISAGTLQIGNGGTTGSVAGDIVNNGILTFNRSNDAGFSGEISGTGALVQKGSGTLSLSGENSYAGGTTISAGALSVANNGNLGAAAGGLTLDGGRLLMTESFDNARTVGIGSNGGTLDAASGKTNVFAGVISGPGGLTTNGAGTIILSGENTYAGGTTISAGTLQIGNGGTTGSVTGDIVNNGALVFNHASIETYAGELSGTGSLTVKSPGGLTLAGDSSSFTGITTVDGTLVVDGVLGSEAISVTQNGELGGSGRIMGSVSISDGGRLVGIQGETQTFEKTLSLSTGSIIDVSLGIPSGTQALFDVAGDLTLRGTINVASLGGFGVGTYRLFDYAGLLNYANGDVTFGERPDGVGTDDLSLRTSVAHQVTLINQGGLQLGFWDGGNAANADNSVVNGGDGIWNRSNAAWTDEDGLFNDNWVTAEFAIFEGTAGTVAVDNGNGNVSASGLQFAVDGYLVNGDALNLAPKDADGNVMPVVRVGDGTAEGASITATIASEITGIHGLAKTDFGTLILSGDNSYTGGTAISQGNLHLGNGGTSGSVTGNVVIGTSDVYKTALVVDRSDLLTLDQTLSGSGKLVQKGSGTTILVADNSYMGGTEILNGVVQIRKDANLGGGEVTIDGGKLQFDADASLSADRTVVLGANGGVIDTQENTDLIAGLIAGDGELTKEGSGTLILTADNAYSGGTAINDGILQFGNGGATGGVEGDLAIAQGAKLAINRSNQSVINGVISGGGGLSQEGSGVTILTAENSYEGGTSITGGILEVGSDNNLGALTGSIAIDGGILRFNAGFDTDRDIVIGDSNAGIDTLGNTNKINGAASGTGGLIKDGSGTLILTGENSYAGGSQINQGVLQIGDGGTDGSITGDVALVAEESELVFDLAKDMTLDGVISGAGSLTQQGSGVTTVTKVATYTGETTISDGELRLAGQGSIEKSERLTSDGRFDIASIDGASSTIQSLKGNSNGQISLGDKTLVITNARDKVDAAKEEIYAGTINGTGGISIAGGKERLTGESTYTGGTQIDMPGTLIIGDGGTKGSIAGEINIEGKLIYDRSDRYTINLLTGGGELELDGSGTGIIDVRQSLSGEIVIGNSSVLVLEGAGDISAASGVTSNGTFDLSRSDQNDVSIGHVRGGSDGQVTLGDKNLVIANGDGSEFAGGISGNGGIIVENGKQILSGSNSYAGETLIRPAGELQLGNEGRVSSLASNVVAEGMLSGNGSMNGLLNRGVVSPGTDTQFGTLLVKRNYVSEGGRLVLNIELNGDNSKGDRLVVAGNTSGTTAVTVINRGGLGAQTVSGIDAIEIGGQSDGVFNLNGDYINYRGAQAVVAGAYAYTLEKGGVSNPEGNWYLRSERNDKQAEPEYQAGVSVYGSAASALERLNRGSFAGFGSRMDGKAADGGEQQSDADGSVTRQRYFWGRVLGGYSFSTLSGSATGSTYGSHDWILQAGLDGQFIDNSAGSLFGSVWVDYTNSNVRTWSDIGNGSVNVGGYGFGSGLTWLGSGGFYLDGQGKANWYNSDMDSDIFTKSLATGVKSWGYALSLEAGQRFSLSERWSITPQAQLIWSSLNTRDYHDVFAASVNIPNSQSLSGRFGLAADYSETWLETNSTATSLTVGGIINVYQDLKSSADYILVSGTRIATGEIDKTWGELGLSTNYSWDNEAYSVYAKTSLAAGLLNFADSYSVSGNVGFRVKW